MQRMKEEITFKSLDDVLEYFGWRSPDKEVKKCVNTEDKIPGASEDREATRDAG